MALTYKQKFNRKFGFPLKTSHSMEDISKLTGYKKSGLEKIYEKGVGAYYSNPTSVRLKGSFKKNVDAPMSMKLSPQQWGKARVYSAVMKGKTYNLDKNLLKR